MHHRGALRCRTIGPLDAPPPAEWGGSVRSRGNGGRAGGRGGGGQEGRGRGEGKIAGLRIFVYRSVRKFMNFFKSVAPRKLSSSSAGSIFVIGTHYFIVIRAHYFIVIRVNNEIVLSSENFFEISAALSDFLTELVGASHALTLFWVLACSRGLAYLRSSATTGEML